MSLLKVIKDTATKIFDQHGPEITIGLGLAGFITTTICVAKATPKALVILQDEYVARKNEEGQNAVVVPKADKITKEFVKDYGVVDTVKTAGKCFVPPILTGVASAACIIFGTTENNRRNAALSAAYTLAETNLSEYKEKVLETIGEKKATRIRDEIAKDKVAETVGQPVIITGQGTMRIFESLSGRKIETDIEKVRQALNRVNKRLYSEHFISVNEYFDEVGIDSIGLGDLCGWSVDDGPIEVQLSSVLDTDGVTPLLYVGYDKNPVPKYRRY